MLATLGRRAARSVRWSICSEVPTGLLLWCVAGLAYRVSSTFFVFLWFCNIYSPFKTHCAGRVNMSSAMDMLQGPCPTLSAQR
jgi:hypothetical protein